MINKIIKKISICFVLFLTLISLVGCGKKVNEKQLLKNYEWINETYRAWIINDSDYYIKEEAAYEFFKYIQDEYEIDEKYLNLLNG